MPRVRHLQQRFTQGEIDPRMVARTDIDQFYGACENMQDVFPIPQGGFMRRPGLEFVDYLMNQITREAAPTITAPRGGTTANANDDDTTTVLTTTTNISTINPYVVVQYDLGSSKSIAFIDIIGAYLSAGSDATEFKLQGSTDNVTFTTLATIAMTTTPTTAQRYRILASYRYIRFARIGATDLTTAKANIQEMQVWVDTGTLSDSRHIEFAFSTSQTYDMVITTQNIAVYKDAVLQADIRVPLHLNGYLNELSWTQSADTLILFSPDVPTWKIVRNGSDALWLSSAITWDFIPQYDFVPVITQPAQTLTPSAANGNVTLTAGGGTIFSAGSVNQYVSGNGGRARIVTYVSATVVKAITEIPFFDATAMASGSWDYETGFEPVWSSTRGYANCGTFHEGRLWLGGSRSRPSTLWGSRVGLFFDFDPGQLLDDDGIDITLDTGQFNKIINVYSGRALQVFTTGGEHAIYQSLGEPITPTNINAKKQTSVGSREGLRVLDVEGTVLYVQREGESIQGFVYDDTQQAFLSRIISLISSHLIKSPVDFALRKATSTEDGNYLLIVNDDGTLTAAALMLAQEVVAFAPQVTNGSFLRCGVDNGDMYFTVERSINNATVRYIERFNFDHYMDSSTRRTSGLPEDHFTGLGHLEGETVKVRADDANLPDVTVTSGAVTINRDAEDDVEFGMDYTPLVKDLRIEVQQIGTAIGLKKNLSEVALELFETQNINVNGKEQSFQGFGPAGSGSPLDVSPTRFSGTKIIKGFRGWGYSNDQVTITQTKPGPLTVLAIMKRVNM